MSAAFVVWGKIVPTVLNCKSFTGWPDTRAEQLQLDRRDVATLRTSIVGKPLRYNHDDATDIGRVGDDRICADGSWDVRLDLSDATPEGRSCIKFVREGHLHGVSLKHRSGDLTPLEVSLCHVGARGPRSRLLPGGVCRDSKSQLYTAERARASIIAASQSYMRDDNELTICSFTVMSVSASVSASASAPASDQAPTLAEAESALPVFGQAREVLQGNATQAQREQLIETVGDLEMARVDADTKNRDLETRLATSEARMRELETQLVAKVSSEALAAAKAASESLDFNKRYARDMMLAYTAPGDEHEVPDLVDALTPAQTAVLARMAVNVEASASPHAVVERAVTAKMQAWLQNSKRGMPPAAAAAAAAPLVVQASAAKRQRVEVWGEAMARVPVSRTVAASAGANDEYDSEMAQEPFVPGAGPNFKHAFMLPEQISVFYAAPRMGAPTNTFVVANHMSKETIMLRKQAHIEKNTQ